MTQSKFLFFGLISIIFIASCSVESLNDPIIISLVDKEFELEMIEDLSATDNNILTIKIASLEDEDCLNASILTASNAIEGGANITIFDIVTPDDCEAGMAPARGMESLGALEEGDYTLEIELQDVIKNIGTLEVSDSRYKINMETEEGITWQESSLLKMPETALWGYTSYSDVEMLDIANEFIQEIESISRDFEGQSGNYAYFSVENEDTFVINNMDFIGGVRSFVRMFNGTSADIDELVQRYNKQANEAIRFYIFDGKGNEWAF